MHDGMQAGDDDERIRALAALSKNFGYLLDHDRLLVAFGAAAEAFVYADPNTAVVKARQFGERLARLLVRTLNLKIRHGTPSQQERIQALVDAGVLVPEVEDAFQTLRREGNKANHEGYGDVRVALHVVNRCFELGQWYHLALTGTREVRGFVPPEPTDSLDPVTMARLREDVDRYRTELAEAQLRLEGSASRLAAEEAARREAQLLVEEALRDRDEALAVARALEARIEVLAAEQAARDDALAGAPNQMSAARREAFVARARQPRPLNEAETRRVIDRMLAEAGWSVQDYDEMNVGAGLGVAVREFPLAGGRADYVLYVNGRIVGVIEAKREGTSLSPVERQTARYATALRASHRLALWRPDEPVPFRYESTGVETFFTNTCDPQPRSRQVFSFHQPATVAGWMREAYADPDAPTLRARLRRMPELATDPLRRAQAEAVRGVEGSLAQDLPRALVQMATGAGKTYAAVTLSYRLLAYAKARRVLFLVDRNHLGRQALAEFRNYVTPDDGRKFTELYGVERLTGRLVLNSSKVVICTIQRMYSLLRGEALPDVDDDSPDLDSYDRQRPAEVGYNPDVPPETFDLIVVDECHRSIYGTWRPVLEYFDAYVVGLTATPVRETFAFFRQNLVSFYTFEQAVADGVNVDFEVYRIRTEITESGGRIPAGVVVPKRDRRTRRQRLEELDDDLNYTGRSVGRDVVNPDQIRLVLSTFRDRLFTEIFPGRSTVPKTLIFAVDDNHAEDVVRIAREVFGRGNDFAAKITHAVRREGGDPDDLIARFRTDPALRIAVTVDLIATGTDVRPIECVMFLRRVGSRTYFEQMKGRGARTIDATEFQAVTPDARTKNGFVIVDAVGVTETELPEAAPLHQHTEQQISLERLLEKTATRAISADETATLAARLAALDRDVTDAERDEIAQLAGATLRALARGMVDAIDPDAREAARLAGGAPAERDLLLQAIRPLTENPRLRTRLLEIRRAHDIVYDEVNRDRLIEARPLSRVEVANQAVTSWRYYLQEHRDEIAAMQVAMDRRGGHGTYALLKELAERIARPPYRWTSETLWKAYETLGKASARPGVRHGITELMTLMRYELGCDSELRPYESVIRERFQAWLLKQEQAGVRFTPDQMWWLERIVDVVVNSAEIEPATLEEPPFTERGGSLGFEHAFGANAAALLTELDQELTA